MVSVTGHTRLRRRSARALTVLALACASAFAAAACGANSTAEEPSASVAAANLSTGQTGGSKGTIGVILPETATSARWEEFDKPFLVTALNAEGFAADIQNAQGDPQKFITIADGLIAKNVKVLVLAAPNAQVGNAVEAKARQAGIPTIDYDRLNAGGHPGYLVTFDGPQVGVLQAQALAAALKSKRGAEVIQIEGSPGEYNAVQFHKGQMSVLRPLYDNSTLKLVRDQFTPDWNNQLGGTEFEQILTAHGGKVDGVVAANDGLAGAVITVLKKNHLNGKIPVTGQDATLAGLQAILRGDQTMTVFKAIKQQADATAKLAGYLASGDTAAADAYASKVTIDPTNGEQVKSVLLQPEAIFKDGVKKVVDQGYITAAQLCTGDLKSVCSSLDIG